MRTKLLLVAFTVLLAAAWQGHVAAEIMWIGLGDDTNWSTGDNWQDAGGEIGTPPANPDTGEIIFREDGSAVDDTVITSSVDPDVGDPLTWEVDTLHCYDDENTPGTDFWHSIDLLGNTLAVRDLRVNYLDSGRTSQTVRANCRITNGTVQIVGTDSKISVAGMFDRTTGYGSLVLDPGVTLTGNIDKIQIGFWTHGVGSLDLRGVIIDGGTLSIGDLDIAVGGRGGARGDFSELMLDETTVIDTFEVTGTAKLGDDTTAWARLGDPDNEWKLPPDLNLKFGVDAGNRGNLYLGCNRRDGAEGRLIATSGGTLTCYLNEMWVANDTTDPTNSANDDWSRGELDASNMDSCQLDIVDLQVGNTTKLTQQAEGSLLLPVGTATVENVTVGDPLNPADSSSGLIQLNGTVFSVTSSLSVGEKGTIETNVDGSSCGLDLADGVALTTTDGATIDIIFLADQAGGDPSIAANGEYYGLRWEGDHRGELSILANDSILIWDDTAVAGKTAGIAFDGTHTYVALRSVWPATAIALNLTVEIAPPTFTTVVVGVDDIDASPADPDVIGRTITCPQDEDADPSTVTVTTLVPAQFDITLTLTKTGGPQASDVGTLTVVLAATGTGDDVTWSGLDALARPEWFWGANWTGGAPPVDPTTAVITFGDGGTDAPSALAASREIGRLVVSNLSGDHDIDLGGNTLAVLGPSTPEESAIKVGMLVGTSKMTVTNGTLQIGNAPQDISIGTNGIGELVVGDGVTLDASLNVVTIVGHGNYGTGQLDLRGATIAGGTLTMSELKMGFAGSGGTDRLSKIVLDDTTTIDGIHITDLVGLAYNAGAPATAKIGNPLDNWKLPAGVDLTFGDPGVTRAEVKFGVPNFWRGDGRIYAKSGGTLTVYASDMWIGHHLYTDARGGDPNRCAGVLDCENMDSCDVDVQTLIVGNSVKDKPLEIGGWQGPTISEGHLYLPPGTATVGSATIGDNSDPFTSPDPPFITSGPSMGLLRLRGTDFDVTGSLTVKKRGTIVTNVSGRSCGIDLAAAATLTVEDEGGVNGLIHIVFDGTAPGPGVYYGLRWEGYWLAELEALNVAGKLTWDDTLLNIATGNTVTIFTDEFLTYTYVGVSTLCDGDVNRDNKVNILDMIGIRNHLNQDPTTPPENAAYDVNDDGNINILDMIYVRNRLNTACP